MSDSLMIEATGQGIDRLRQVLELSPFRKSSRVTTDGVDLVFHRFGDDLPTPLDIDAMAFMAMGYLDNPQRAYGKEPNIDGDCEKSWKVRASRMEDEIRVSPHWMIFHK